MDRAMPFVPRQWQKCRHCGAALHSSHRTPSGGRFADAGIVGGQSAFRQVLTFMADAELREGHEIATEIEIAAAPHRVWSVLLDFASYPEWNPMIRSIEGVALRDERLRIVIKPKGGLGMTLRPRILTALPNCELRWRGGFRVPRLLEGEHYFLIEPLGPDRVRLRQGERFSGILFRLFAERFRAVTRAGFEAANGALKQRCESFR